MIPGHELSGRVVAVGEGVSGFAPGTVVASGAGISCGECFQCRAGLTNLCLRYSTVGLHRDGGLAQLCAVPAATCLDVAQYGLDEQVAALASRWRSPSTRRGGAVRCRARTRSCSAPAASARSSCTRRRARARG